MSGVQETKKTTETVPRNQSGTPKPRSDSSSSTASFDSTITSDGADYAINRNPESPSAAEIPQITSDRRNSFLKLL